MEKLHRHYIQGTSGGMLMFISYCAYHTAQVLEKRSGKKHPKLSARLISADNKIFLRDVSLHVDLHELPEGMKRLKWTLDWNWTALKISLSSSPPYVDIRLFDLSLHSSFINQYEKALKKAKKDNVSAKILSFLSGNFQAMKEFRKKVLNGEVPLSLVNVAILSSEMRT